jgi:hypothetical protein
MVCLVGCFVGRWVSLLIGQLTTVLQLPNVRAVRQLQYSPGN